MSRSYPPFYGVCENNKKFEDKFLKFDNSCIEFLKKENHENKKFSQFVLENKNKNYDDINLEWLMPLLTYKCTCLRDCKETLSNCCICKKYCVVLETCKNCEKNITGKNSYPLGYEWIDVIFKQRTEKS